MKTKVHRHGIISNLLEQGALPAAGSSLSSPELIRVLKKGLPVSELEFLQNSLQVPMDKLASLLGISKSTLHRRRTAGLPFDTDQSDRIIRYTRLLRFAFDVLESKELARQWLTTPQPGLGGAIPLEYAQTEVGGREVEDLLGRLEFAVYS